jgi:AcrR family transcriptional regulator
MNRVTADEDLSGWDRRRNDRLTELEQLALEMFAERGFSRVTVDEIASKAGVSARTLFRYFPVKEEILLGYVRRGTARIVELIESLGPDPDPVGAVWTVLRDDYRRRPSGAQVSNLWRSAAREAPEVSARAIGERVRMLMDAVTVYVGCSLGLDPATDHRPRLIAGPLVGIDEAIVESIGRSRTEWDELLAFGDAQVRRLTAGSRLKKR